MYYSHIKWNRQLWCCERMRQDARSLNRLGCRCWRAPSCTHVRHGAGYEVCSCRPFLSTASSTCFVSSLRPSGGLPPCSSSRRPSLNGRRCMQ